MSSPQPNCLTINNTCPNGYTAAKCSYYSGSTLTCTGIKYNDSVDLAIKKLNDKVCSIQNNPVGAGFTSSNQLQMLIGDPSSILLVGDDQIILYNANIVDDSVWITRDGLEMPRDLTDRRSYHVIYGDNAVTINFNYDVEDGELYRLHYDYNSASMTNISYEKLQFKIGQSNSPMIAGDTQLNVLSTNIILNTLLVIVNSDVLNENSSGDYTGELTYVYSIITGGFTLTFSDPAITDQDYIITYAKIINS